MKHFDEFQFSEQTKKHYPSILEGVMIRTAAVQCVF